LVLAEVELEILLRENSTSFLADALVLRRISNLVTISRNRISSVEPKWASIPSSIPCPVHVRPGALIGTVL
jgi:hypothetical protein